MRKRQRKEVRYGNEWVTDVNNSKTFPQFGFCGTLSGVLRLNIKTIITFETMPYKEHEISKMYYTMGEVAAIFDVNQSLIRFYEKEFDVLQPKKNKKGNRYFTPEDIEHLRIIFHLIRDKGYTINGAREHLKKNMDESKESQRVIDSLESIKRFLLEVREQL
ncbi:MAG: MerR family transcriptional regulator [Mucilaginibacter sp.]|nr:MerR family transcriptional regulator [Mucilaginibacter sp.]